MKRLAFKRPAPLAITAFAIFLGACATLSEDACRSGDWFSIGAADGADGRTPGFLAKHAEACAKFGITPDRREWEAGRQQGLRSYCTPEKAYSEGRRGRSLSPVCPAADLRELSFANETGLEYHRIEHRIDRLEDDIREINAALADLGEEDASLRASLVLERLMIRNRIARLRFEQRRYDRVPEFL